MKINVNQKIFTEDLKPFSMPVSENGEEQRTATFKDLMLMAINRDTQSTEKSVLFKFIVKAHSNPDGNINIEASDAAELSKTANRIFNAVVYGQMDKILNGEDNPLKKLAEGDEGESKSKEKLTQVKSKK